MANRFTFPRETALDANGNPLAGAKLYFYESGTTNPADSFADDALTIANTNPVVADSAGRFGDIFLTSTDYKVILQNAAEVTTWTADPVSGTVSAAGDKFIPSQQSPADMTVLVGPGTIFDTASKTRLSIAAQISALMVAPATQPRNDIVYVDRRTGMVGVQTGVEAALPTDPTIPDGKLPVARVRLATTTIEIDSSLIDDIRELELLGDFGPQDIQNQTFTAFDDTGIENAYVITPDPAITAYAKYQAWTAKIANANTGASTMNINGLGEREIFDRRTGAGLAGGEIAAGIHCFVDDGDRLVLVNPVHANIDVQIFTASGFWTKPSRASKILVEAWGGGGGGAGVSSYGGGGGGGGAYKWAWIDAAGLSATEVVTIGTGGTSVAGNTGNRGGNTTFGSLLTVYGGFGGIVNNNGGHGGGWEPGASDLPRGWNGAPGATSGGAAGVPAKEIWGGGGGGLGGAGAAGINAGGASTWGGGGGGGRNAPGGVSDFGGNGGASGAPATDGSAPSGGGGGGNGGSGTAGANGARGEMKVTTWVSA